MTFIIGKQQAQIFDAFENGEGHLQIGALAGTGKTTTAIEMMSRAKPGLTMAMMAFNKSIKLELERKVPAGVFVSTLNGFGFSSFPRNSRKLNGNKSAFILQDLLGADRYDPQYNAYKGPVSKLVSAAKGRGLGFDGKGLTEATADELFGIMEHLSIEGPERKKNTPDNAGVVRFAIQVLQKSLDHPTLIDFDDQLWIPVLKNWTIRKFDLLFVDEAQDLNPIQQELMSRALNPGGRIIIIGDENQAIYGFRGADSESMANMQKRFNATVLPLSVTWRCGTSIVEEAQKIVPEFEAAPNAEEGEVIGIDCIEDSEFESTDMLVCRTNAPLVRAAFRLLRRKVPFDFLGRDLGSNLTATVRKTNGKTNQDLDVFMQKLRQRTESKVKQARDKENEGQAQTLLDLEDSITVFAEEAEDVPGLVKSIDDFFSTKLFASKKMTICSIHKSKGLEAERVFILEFDKMPARWAKKEHDKRQELNLKYVAITRAKKTLFLVDSDKKERQPKQKGFFAWEEGSDASMAGGSYVEREMERSIANVVDEVIEKHHPDASAQEIATAVGGEATFMGRVIRCRTCMDTGWNEHGECQKCHR